jgi:hypothetical protein
MRPRCAADPPPEKDSDTPDGGSGASGELRDVLDASVREAMRRTSDDDLRAADRRVFDSLVETGEDDLRQIGDAVAEELTGAGDALAERAEALLAAAMEETLAQFDERRAELMREALAQRDAIRVEADQIEALAASLNRRSPAPAADKGSRGKQSALFAASGLFALAAVTYAWLGFAEQSSAAMQSAALDACAAGAAAFFYQRGERGDGRDGKR